MFVRGVFRAPALDRWVCYFKHKYILFMLFRKRWKSQVFFFSNVWLEWMIFSSDIVHFGLFISYIKY